VRFRRAPFLRTIGADEVQGDEPFSDLLTPRLESSETGSHGAHDTNCTGQHMRPIAFACIIAAAVTAGCAQSPVAPPSASFSQADADSIAARISSSPATAAKNNAPSSTGHQPPHLTLQGITCNSNYTSCQIFQQMDETYTCQGGGSRRLSGQLSGSVNSSGLGYISMQGHETYTDYACEPDWVYNGNPYISFSGTVHTTASTTSMNFSEDGGFTATNKTSGTVVNVQVHLSVLWDSITGGSFTGTVTASPGGTFGVSGHF
jgi:hypothetical protein